MLCLTLCFEHEAAIALSRWARVDDVPAMGNQELRERLRFGERRRSLDKLMCSDCIPASSYCCRLTM